MKFDFYAPHTSLLHRLDPRVKIVMTVAFMILAFHYTALVPTAILLLLLHGLFALAHIEGRTIRGLWYFMLPITIMIILFWPLFDTEGTAFFTAGPIVLAAEALLRGLAMALRMCNLAFTVFLLLFTTDQIKLIHGLVAMKLPFGAGLMLSIALRYIPAFFSIYQMVCDAQRSRGLSLKKGSFLHRLKAYIPILIAVIITGLKTVTNLSYALETRGFGMKAAKGRTSYDHLHLRPCDKVLLAAVPVVTASLLFLS